MKTFPATFFAALLALAAPVEARTYHIDAGQGAALVQAFAQARTGDTIQLDRGRYELPQTLTLTADRVEIHGANADNTILSFAHASPGAGLSVSGREVNLRDFSVENAQGDAVVAHDCDRLTLRDVRASWSAPAPAHASGVRVANCTNILIEQVAADGAAMAGVLVVGSRNAIVRETNAHGSFIGLALVNSAQIDATANTLSGNAFGAAVFDAPSNSQAGGSIRLFHNAIADNNAAAPGNLDNAFASIPSSVGVLIMSTRNVHVFDNDIGGHGSTNVLVMAYPGSAGGNASFNPLPRDVMIRDNRFGAAGATPQGDLAGMASPGHTLSDVIWDGANAYSTGGAPHSEIVRIVMRDNRSSRGGIGSFLNLGIGAAGIPFSEAAPDPAFPPLVNLTEPKRVRLP